MMHPITASAQCRPGPLPGVIIMNDRHVGDVVCNQPRAVFRWSGRSARTMPGLNNFHRARKARSTMQDSPVYVESLRQRL